ncbi:MAG: FAD-binding oxidoreductase [Acidiferrobacterales bacterium]
MKNRTDMYRPVNSARCTEHDSALWQGATVERIRVETEGIKTFTLRLREWKKFMPGQHVDVRLSALGSNLPTSSFSIASAPEAEGVIELTIQWNPDDALAGYFHGRLQSGDTIALKGPLGEDFVWSTALGGPLLLIAGGSGVVPMMSMLRHRANVDLNIPALLLYSVNSLEDVIYREELDHRSATESQLTVLYTLTEEQPASWGGYARRIDRAMLANTLAHLGTPAHVYVCGSTGFVQTVRNGLATLPVPGALIRTAQFDRDLVGIGG